MVTSMLERQYLEKSSNQVQDLYHNGKLCMVFLKKLFIVEESITTLIWKFLKHIWNSSSAVMYSKGLRIFSNLVAVPKTSTIKNYLQFISQLLDQDSPQMFGLPPNIDRSVRRFNSQKYINVLKAIIAISKEDLKFDREKWAKALRHILKL